MELFGIKLLFKDIKQLWMFIKTWMDVPNMCIKIDNAKQSAIWIFSLPIVKKIEALPFADSKVFKKYPKYILQNIKKKENKKK